MTQIEDLKEIRNLMERSSRFLSLSGLSGIIAGSAALAGTFFAWWYIRQIFLFEWSHGVGANDFFRHPILVILADAMIVFLVALFSGIYFSWKKAKKQGLSFWNKTCKRLILHFFLPLVTGGFFCIFLLYHQYYVMVIPASLVFYGLGLINASKYTYDDTLYFGLAEILLGLLSAYFVRYGLWFWGIGFGVLHIIYGIVIYYKYDHGSAHQ
jgi:hypothetical protein